MSDRTLRESARRSNQTGSIEDEAQLLQARVRAGELAADRLSLAAYLGDPAARLVLGPLAPSPAKAPPGWNHGVMEPEAADLEHLVRGLAPWGDECCARAALAMGWHVLPLTGPIREEAEAALKATEAWVDCPCVEHAEAARTAGETVNDQVTPFTERTLRLSVWTAGDITCVPWGATHGTEPAWKAAGEVVRRASLVSSVEALQRAVVDTVLAWCLTPRGDRG